MGKAWASVFISEKCTENHVVGWATHKSPEHLDHKQARPRILLEKAWAFARSRACNNKLENETPK